MGKQRKTWSAEVKEAVVLTVLRGEVSVAEAARQHGANESLIHTWKTTLQRSFVMHLRAGKHWYARIGWAVF